MKLKYKLGTIIALSFFVLGCARPWFDSPGTIGMQRSRAVIHDPYPSDDLGPAVIGGRPLGFDRPQSEATNLQQVRESLVNGQAYNQPPFNPQYRNGTTLPAPAPTIPQPTPQFQPSF